MTPPPRVFYMVSTDTSCGLTSVSLGLVRALDREGLRVAFYKPVHQPELRSSSGHVHSSHQGMSSDSDCEDNYEDIEDRSTHFLRATGNFDPPEPLAYTYAQNALKSDEDMNVLLEAILEQYEEVIQAKESSVVVVEGMTPNRPGIEILNQKIAGALDAKVILVTSLTEGEHEDVAQFANLQSRRRRAPSMRTRLHRLEDKIERSMKAYGGDRLAGVIVNKVNSPHQGIHLSRKSFVMPTHDLRSEDIIRSTKLFSQNQQQGMRLLGAIPWSQKLLNVRTSDMARHLGTKVMYEGDMNRRRVGDICLVARNVSHMVDRLKRDTLIITPIDREDILLAACMAELNGVPLAGVVLTGDQGQPSKSVMMLCEKVIRETGMPLLTFHGDSYAAAATASAIDREVPKDDQTRMEKVMDRIASHLDVDTLRDALLSGHIDHNPRLSPPAFMHQLVSRARKAGKRIVLPEGNDPRVIRAAVKCQDRGIAKCILLGDPDEVNRLARAQGITNMPSGLEILEPTSELREKYVASMVELRKHKGCTEEIARAQLEDITVLATMMLAVGEVDGLVSGAIHTTANTIRPALQLIKSRPNTPIVSSVFFMLLPDQVVLYGDCAINPDPSPVELASIAIESAESAKAFGIDARVAMISYSTGSSGKGSDVEKVREATSKVKELRPDILVDGPLQYDAASTMDVAKSKAPESPVAGQATVLVFPDLNTGNTTYKAVQRTANVVCVGPMLQGLRRPVNDLSRGALVDDIVFTIALTSIQAEQTEMMEQQQAAI